MRGRSLAVPCNRSALPPGVRASGQVLPNSASTDASRGSPSGTRTRRGGCGVPPDRGKVNGAWSALTRSDRRCRHGAGRAEGRAAVPHLRQRSGASIATSARYFA